MDFAGNAALRLCWLSCCGNDAGRFLSCAFLMLADILPIALSCWINNIDWHQIARSLVSVEARLTRLPGSGDRLRLRIILKAAMDLNGAVKDSLTLPMIMPVISGNQLRRTSFSPLPLPRIVVTVLVSLAMKPTKSRLTTVRWSSTSPEWDL